MSFELGAGYKQTELVEGEDIDGAILVGPRAIVCPLPLGGHRDVDDSAAQQPPSHPSFGSVMAAPPTQFLSTRR